MLRRLRMTNINFIDARLAECLRPSVIERYSIPRK